MQITTPQPGVRPSQVASAARTRRAPIRALRSAPAAARLGALTVTVLGTTLLPATEIVALSGHNHNETLLLDD